MTTCLRVGRRGRWRPVLAWAAVALGMSVAGCGLDDGEKPPLYVRDRNGHWRQVGDEERAAAALAAQEKARSVARPPTPGAVGGGETPASKPAQEAVLVEMLARVEVERPGAFERDVIPRTRVRTGEKALTKLDASGGGKIAVQYWAGAAEAQDVFVEVRLQFAGPREDSQRWVLMLTDGQATRVRTALRSGESLTLVVQPQILERLGPAEKITRRPDVPKGPIRVEEATTNPTLLR